MLTKKVSKHKFVKFLLEMQKLLCIKDYFGIESFSLRVNTLYFNRL